MFAAPLAAQDARSDAFLQQQRRIEEQVRQALNTELPTDQRVDFDYGGWYSFYLMMWDDGVESSRTFRQHDVRPWGSLRLDQGAHEFYARLRLQFLDFNHGDAFDGNDDDTFGPNLDRGYYQFDLRQAMRAYAGQDIDGNIRFKVGRDFVQFGTGFALAYPMDHIAITAELGDFEVVGLGGMAVRSFPDIDRSRPDSGSTERNFWGTQITYTGFEKHRPFVYAFWNKDQKTRPWFVRLQDFDYDTYYLGLGSTGELFRNLRYATELVFEGGDSYGDRRFLQKDDVEAWAYDLQLEYTWQRKFSPRIIGEYMFASGDGNRANPTNAIGGNRRGNDTSFSGFGWRDTGLSFAPRLSNVHIWRLGGAIKPFEDIRALRELEIGTDWFLYSKHHRDGGVSDFTADRGSSYLGWEMDYFLNWRITSDLSYTARFGTFFPGGSFSDQTTRTFFLTGVTWSF